jgi:hypothetical protein
LDLAGEHGLQSQHLAPPAWEREHQASIRKHDLFLAISGNYGHINGVPIIYLIRRGSLWGNNLRKDIALKFVLIQIPVIETKCHFKETITYLWTTRKISHNNCLGTIIDLQFTERHMFFLATE